MGTARYSTSSTHASDNRERDLDSDDEHNESEVDRDPAQAQWRHHLSDGPQWRVSDRVDGLEQDEYRAAGLPLSGEHLDPVGHQADKHRQQEDPQRNVRDLGNDGHTREPT